MHQLQLQTQHLPDAKILRLAGAIVAANFVALQAVLNDFLRLPAPKIILECGQINYIGSTELQELLNLAHMARARGGDIKCARLSPTIEQVATLIANGDPLECFPDVSYALESFHTSAVPA